MKSRVVLVTGAGGFIGSHLVERLIECGAHVRAFCLYNSNNSLGWLDQSSPNIKDNIEVWLGDIRDGRYVEQAVTGADIVFHLAALIAIPYSYRAPESFIDTNVKGTLNILEAARKAGCQRVIHTSTSEVYGTPQSIPISETHPLQGQSPYSASKIAADKLCEAFFCSYELPVVILRPFNTYGPRQSLRAVLPTIITQLLAGKKKIELGRLDPKRDLTFVADTVEGFIKCAMTDSLEGQVIQLGTGKTISIADLFETTCRVLNKKAEVISSAERIRPTRSEVIVLMSDPSKAAKLLNWTHKTSIEQGIEQTALWLGKHLENYNINRYHI
ncbi:SDR family NAD(P)-dependent oxidoreductase [bacterium]|nr:SDR family NAD(P)-dependent oxidoreductase [bacterium]